LLVKPRSLDYLVQEASSREQAFHTAGLNLNSALSI
jgi:hypothetical protein